MIPYFDDDKEWENYLSILRSWLGTPFRHLWMAKGRGVDCTLYLGACLLEAGILAKVEYDYYPIDWHVHTHEERVMEGFYNHIENHLSSGLTMARLEPNVELMRGDILGFSTTKMKVTNHCGIITQEAPALHMINAIARRGVCEIKYVRWWERMLKIVFRIIKE